jgi:hypothetical protein
MEKLKKVRPVYVWLFGGLVANLSFLINDNNETLQAGIAIIGCLIAIAGILLYFRK